jgi:hypothetical protein
MRILQWLLRTDSGVMDPILRITLAVVIFPQHGAQKVFGWFGGHGFKGTMKYFTDKADQCRKKTNPSRLLIPVIRPTIRSGAGGE